MIYTILYILQVQFPAQLSDDHTWTEPWDGDYVIIKTDNTLYEVVNTVSVSVNEVVLRKSKIGQDRNTVESFTLLPSNDIVVLSKDKCIMLVPREEEQMVDSQSILSFLCPYCGHTFTSHRDLHRFHMRGHRGPVRCRICMVN